MFFKLRPYQVKFCRACADAFTKSTEGQGPFTKVLGVAATGAGKCWARGTRMMLASGRVKLVEDLKPGELLLGPDGIPRRIETTNRGVGNLYELAPHAHGEAMTVNAEHVLVLKCTGTGGKRVTLTDGRKVNEGDIVEIELRDYMNESKTAKHCLKWFQVPFQPIAEPGDSLPIPPYLLGFWLADGSKNHAEIHKPKAVEYCAEDVEKMGWEVHRKKLPDGKCECAAITGGFYVALKELGLIGAKTIPPAYLRADEEARKALLAGFLDGDGYHQKGGFEVVQRDFALAKQVMFLARSLGFAVTPSAKWVKLKQWKEPRKYLRMYLSGGPALNCKRHVVAERKQVKDALMTGFSIRSVGQGTYHGVTISGPDRRLLMPDGTVSHNTIMAAALVWWITRKPRRTGRVLMLADTDELVQQAADKILAATGLIPDIEKAASRASTESPVVVGSIQTISRRLERWPADHFDLVIVDECLIAGTMIGEKPIEEIKVGDLVPSFCHRTGKEVLRRVLATRRSVPSDLLTVTASDGRTLTSTGNHPFFSSTAYKPCNKLEKGNPLLCNELQPKMQVPDLLKSLESRGRGPLLFSRVQRSLQTQKRTFTLFILWRLDPLRKKIPPVLGKGWKTLLRRLRAESNCQSKPRRGTAREIQPQTFLGKNEKKQPDEEKRSEGQNESFSQKNRARPENQGREWSRTDEDRKNAEQENGIGAQCCGEHKATKRLRLPLKLQDRLGKSFAQISNRNRWSEPRRKKQKGARREKNSFPRIVRVESVKIHQPTSDGRFGGNSPDGFVYNIQVEETENYFANGILVHNCHLSMAKNWQRVLGHFHAGGGWILGITATPERGDGQKLMKFYEHIADEIGLFDLINRGHLAPITVRVCPIQIDCSRLTVAKKGLNKGNFDGDELEEAIEPYLEAVIDEWVKHASDRCTLAFHPSIKASKKFTAMLQSRGVAAAHVDGTTKNRKEILADYAAGRIQFLNNAQLLTKGYDCPRIACIINLRPTKSRTQYLQMVGRGTRMCEFKKDCLLLDYLWQFQELGVMRPAALVSDTDEHEEAVARVMARGRPMTLGEASEEAEREREQLIIKQLKKAAARGARHVYDARTLGAVLHQPRLIDYEPRARWEKLPMTHGQRRFLETQGIDPKTVKGLGHAAKIMEVLNNRRKHGMAQPKQVAALAVADAPQASQMTFSEAVAWLDNLDQPREE